MSLNLKQEALAGLSRRERQILEILYQRGKASASEVLAAMENAPSNSAVRTLLRVLEEKGHVKRRAEGLKYVYSPTVAREKARRVVVRRMLDTYFAGSAEQIVAALLDSARPAAAELDRMAAMIEKAKKEGR
jgi:BlaI family transcriptional regulator, penicillinase repressor